jgi:hypothetical protein
MIGNSRALGALSVATITAARNVLMTKIATIAFLLGLGAYSGFRLVRFLGRPRRPQLVRPQ